MAPRYPAGPAATGLSPVQARFRRLFLEKLGTGEYRLEEQAACLCGSVAAHRIAFHDRFGLPSGTVLCTDCGLARSTPRLAAADLPNFYDTIYHGLHQGVPKPNASYALFRSGQGGVIHAYLRDLLPDGPLRVAEIGCGTGHVLHEFREAADMPVTIAGCEYAEAYVQVGRAAGIDVRSGGPESLVPAGPFDVVIMSHVVEHFPDPVRDLRRVRTLGHHTTLYYVEVPGLLRIHRMPQYAYRLDRYLTLAHTYHFSLGTLTATMARAGYARLRGDEGVRAVFAARDVEVEVEPGAAAGTLRYLRGLERSIPLKAARAWLNVRPRAGQLARAVLGERRYRQIRKHVGMPSEGESTHAP